MSKTGVLIWRYLFESGDRRRLAKQVQDLSDLERILDLPYLDDGEKGHLFDVYQMPLLPEDAPVMINIHGGGLFASYKEVNVTFNYEWARLGYRVVSISYRRIPETTLIHQIRDVMAALRYLKEHATDLHLDPERCVITGDSAGALLALFALGIGKSPVLQERFGIPGAGIPFRAAGLISIMLDTQRKDLMRAISDMVTEPDDAGQPWEEYLLDPAKLLEEAELPPLFLVTSEQDLIGKDTRKLDRLLTETDRPHTMLDFPRGEERKLVHVFSVCYPMYPESREVFQRMDRFFREVL